MFFLSVPAYFLPIKFKIQKYVLYVESVEQKRGCLLFCLRP